MLAMHRVTYTVDLYFNYPTYSPPGPPGLSYLSLFAMLEGIYHNGNKNISPLTQPTVCNSAVSIRNTLVILISWTLKLQVPAISRYCRYNRYILTDNGRYQYPPFTKQDNTRLLREKNVC